MKKLKIVHIVQSLETGGAEKLLTDLSISCKEQFDITVISQYKKGNYQYEKLLDDNNIKVIYLDKKKGFDIRNFMDVLKTLDIIKPDAVHTHLHAAIYAIPWYFKNKKAVKVHTVHSIANMEFGRIHRLFQWFAYTFLGVIPVAISDAVKKSILKEYWIDDGIVRVIYNGIDVSKYALPKEAKSAEKPFEVINVASFSTWKNQIFLLNSFCRALSENKFMKLTFVGDGPLRKCVQSRAEELGIDKAQAEFVGVSSRVNEFLSKADIFVLCSTFEGLPLSILEAYAAGLPVIATNVGGVPDILTDGENGFLVPLNDEAALEKAILRLCFDNELRGRISQANREKVKGFDIGVTAGKYIDIYNN